MALQIPSLTHPEYRAMIDDWLKFRRTYEGGKDFVERYVVKFSIREGEADFQDRKNISYCAAQAKSAINDIKNAIFQRTNDVAREDGSKTYQDAVSGLDFGVDLTGNTMSSFIGRLVLPDLLTHAKVGVFVDAPPLVEGTLAEQKSANTRPYIYAYHAEDIRNWSFASNTDELHSVLLRDRVEKNDPKTGLVISIVTQFRLLWKTAEGVRVAYYDSAGTQIDRDGNRSNETLLLNLQHIPFVIFSIQNSLLTDVADYQIALTNLASSDLNYALKSNYPFYTEQYDATSINYSRKSLPIDAGVNNEFNVDNTAPTGAGEAAKAAVAKPNEMNTGAAQGRLYPKGTDRPDFIHPSPEPLIASMAKQEALKLEIRQLVNLSLASIAPQRSSAESKDFDERGLEAGLSYIGLELEFGERQIANLWEEYESEGSVATIKYPTNYSISSNEERRKQAKELKSLQEGVPSVTYKREIAKKITEVTIGADVSIEKLRQIEDEIDQSTVFTSDPETITADHEAGFVGDKMASEMRGYPEGEAAIASTDHAARLARISAAQTTPVRGVPDTEEKPNSSVDDDRNPDA